ncbi:uncharacterized protein LOC117651887 [Thrips palmi]|uniref:Uncharacterized protein LOC117651887 n=1 Tax=Thrips palmi TaxID=161013 RepID=A0A6P9A373_THRPL|nr:uncharacterized protein LOC117651887 [Thrips palmi]XP_034252318.1 uncharacterized protein LOC117651887 [Thrips palmi]
MKDFRDPGYCFLPTVETLETHLTASLSAAAGDLDWWKVQCKKRNAYIHGILRCDGFSQCGDGSDEEGCDALLAPLSVALPANASVTARVQFATVHNSIELHLCGGRSCSRVWLFGARDDGTLRYETYTGCNRLGRGGTIGKHDTEGFRLFAPGEVVLEVQHRPGRLAVWRQGRPDDVVEVPVEADYGTLRVRPSYWVADMSVQFTGASSPAAQGLPGSTASPPE